MSAIDICDLQHLAVGDNWLPAFNQALTDLGPNGGVITNRTGIVQQFRIDGTLDITTQVVIDLGCNNNGSATVGSFLCSTTNAPVLRYPTTSNRFVQLRNVSIVGHPDAGTDQHGIVVANGGLWLDGFTIREMGGNGLEMQNSYCGNYKRGYISLCNGNGIHVNGHVGANYWEAISSAGNHLNGTFLECMDGSDLFVSMGNEQSGLWGIKIGDTVKGCEWKFAYSELNTCGPLRFDAGSEENHVNFASHGWSEPINIAADLRNGTRNSYDGREKDKTRRHMLAGRVGFGQIDNPAGALDIEGGLHVAGWQAIGWQGNTIQFGGVNAYEWTAAQMMTNGLVKANW